MGKVTRKNEGEKKEGVGLERLNDATLCKMEL